MREFISAATAPAPAAAALCATLLFAGPAMADEVVMPPCSQSNNIVHQSSPYDNMQSVFGFLEKYGLRTDRSPYFSGKFCDVDSSGEMSTPSTMSSIEMVEG
jgi:hypothetical protein